MTTKFPNPLRYPLIFLNNASSGNSNNWTRPSACQTILYYLLTLLLSLLLSLYLLLHIYLRQWMSILRVTPLEATQLLHTGHQPRPTTVQRTTLLKDDHGQRTLKDRSATRTPSRTLECKTTTLYQLMIRHHW